MIGALQALAYRQSYLATEARGDPYSELSSYLRTWFPPLDERRLDGARKAVEDGEDVAQGYIHLPLTKRDSLLPILYFRIAQRDGGPAASFCVGMYASETGDVASDLDRVRQAAGFRFEPPEGTEQERSEHGYFHAQPSETYWRNGASVLGPNLISTRLPAFPLYSTNPVELLIATLVSIYGRTQAEKEVQTLDVPPLPGKWP